MQRPRYKIILGLFKNASVAGAMEAWGEIVDDDLIDHSKDFGFYSETDENPLQDSGHQSVMIQLLLLKNYPGI